MTILVACNETPHGLAALQVAINAAIRRASPLAIMCLDPGLDPPAEIADPVFESGVEVWGTRNRQPDEVPANAILDFADEVGAELIVIGTRKRAEKPALSVGTTTQKLLLEAPVPVLVVKDEYGPGAGVG